MTAANRYADLVEGAGHEAGAVLPAVTEFLCEHLAR